MNYILILEDDHTLSEGIRLTLQTPDLQIEQCFTLQHALTRTRQSTFDLWIVDLNLPDGNGLDLLRELRQTNQSPVILLTANDLESDVVLGLELGADDYITKPFSLAVLRARVNTQLRRSALQNSTIFAVAPFFFDFGAMRFHKVDRAIDLSKTEQKLLHILVSNAGQTLSRATLIDRIWTDGAAYVDENALSVTVKRLRDKLEENPSKPDYIKTVYGLGYTWTEHSR